MSELESLKKCIASVENTKDNYAAMASLDVDSEAKLMYNKLVIASSKHLHVLNDRLEDLSQHS